MKRKIITILCVLGIWQVAALLIQKEVILPLPHDVFLKMFELTLDNGFYLAIGLTLLRVFISFIIALILGTLLGVLSGLYQPVKDYLKPVISMLQTIPQIAYILILLVWFNSLTALIMIVLLMLLPVFYYNAMQGIENIQEEYKDIIREYGDSFLNNLIYVYIPLMRGYVLSAIETCLPLSLKVGVMAEIFVSSRYGIGKQLYFARVQIDMVSIFAWMIWMVIIMMVMTYSVRKIVQRYIDE